MSTDTWTNSNEMVGVLSEILGWEPPEPPTDPAAPPAVTPAGSPHRSGGGDDVWFLRLLDLAGLLATLDGHQLVEVDWVMAQRSWRALTSQEDLAGQEGFADQADPVLAADLEARREKKPKTSVYQLERIARWSADQVRRGKIRTLGSGGLRQAAASRDRVWVEDAVDLAVSWDWISRSTGGELRPGDSVPPNLGPVIPDVDPVEIVTPKVAPRPPTGADLERIARWVARQVQSFRKDKIRGAGGLYAAAASSDRNWLDVAVLLAASRRWIVQLDTNLLGPGDTMIRGGQVRRPKDRMDLYPWDEWLDGTERMLSRGADFSCTAKSLRAGAYAAAQRRGLTVGTRIHSEDRLTVRAIRSNPPGGDA